jgi:hypothetical protein
MINYLIHTGQTDVSVVIRIVDSTDGTPELGVVFNTAGLDLKYRRETAANVDITEVTLAALTTVHTDGGFLHIGNGYYRLDLPDAACATGVSGCMVHGACTGMVIVGCYIHLNLENGDDIADKVHDEQTSGHQTAGSAGVKLHNMTYTVANNLDVNVQYTNDTQIAGTGTISDVFRALGQPGTGPA